MRCQIAGALILILEWTLVLGISAGAAELPALEEAIADNRDLYAEAALHQPNGPSYELFKPLIPSLLYGKWPWLWGDELNGLRRSR